MADKSAPGGGGLPEATAAEVLKAAKDCPLLRAVRARVNGSIDILLGINPSRIPHSLGRNVEGYVVTQIDQNAAILRDLPTAVTPPADVSREIVLHSTVNDTLVRLLFY